LKRSRRKKIKRGRIATGDRHLSGTCGLNRCTGRQVEDWISHPSRAFMGSGRDAMKFNGRSAAAKLKTAEKAELLARWRATMGTPRCRLPPAASF
jgi:hypothetical protein